MGKERLKIKAVIFDLGNVLVNYDLYGAANQFAEDGRTSLLKVGMHFFTSSANRDYMSGRITSREFYGLAREKLGLQMSFTTFRDIWNGIFWESPGMEALVKKLARKYPLYLISNTNAMHFEFIKKEYPRLLKPFKKLFPSHRLKCQKPDTEIFKKVLKQIRMKPETTVFIDDTPSFVRGAKKVGMYAIRFRNKKQLVHELKKLGVSC